MYIFESMVSVSGSVVLPMILIVVITVIEVPFTFLMKESKLSS
ncbi:hypothetical protein [Oceanirhabdus seepicola]|nr:hypothetical protein [Oceanirhabdus seepicola]